MRALLAGFLVFAATLVVVVIASSDSKDGTLPWWGIPAILVTLAVSIPSALVIFNSGRRAPKGFGAESISELREKGLIVTETFQAKRIFEVEEFEDEGSHSFIELTDGSVLFLSGQYLYDYRGPAKTDGNTQVSFPCTEFTILRHKTDHYVIDIICGGHALPFEGKAPPFSEKDFAADGVPEDGQIIRDCSYDEIKKERLGK